MNLFIKIFIFIIVFSLLFFGIRISNVIDLHVLILDVSSVPWLYSTIGLIFGITSAFIIQSEWNNWDNLVNSVTEEINALRRLLQFTKHVPGKISENISTSIKKYLEAVVDSWYEDGRSQKAEEALWALQEEMYTVFEKEGNISQIGFSLITKILTHRDSRIHYSSRELPIMLKILVYFSTFLLIFLSLFIGVRNTLLDYIFTLSIAVLGYLILEVINDLSDPLSPGSWHVTNKRYKRLLKEML